MGLDGRARFRVTCGSNKSWLVPAGSVPVPNELTTLTLSENLGSKTQISTSQNSHSTSTLASLVSGVGFGMAVSCLTGVLV